MIDISTPDKYVGKRVTGKTTRGETVTGEAVGVQHIGRRPYVMVRDDNVVVHHCSPLDLDEVGATA